MLQYHCNMIKYKISIRFQITFHNILFLKYISHLHHTKMIHVHSAHIPAGLYLTSKQSSIVNISQRHLQCSSSLRSLQYNMVAIITFICHHIRKNIGNIKCSVHVMEIQTQATANISLFFLLLYVLNSNLFFTKTFHSEDFLTVACSVSHEGQKCGTTRCYCTCDLYALYRT